MAPLFKPLRHPLVVSGFGALVSAVSMFRMWRLGEHAAHDPSSFAWNVFEGIAALVVLAGPGRTFFVSAWSQFRRHNANMDTLVAMGTGVAWIYSAAVLAFPSVFPETMRHPFFESATVVVFFVLLGQTLEGRARKDARSAIEVLADLQPSVTHVARDSDAIDVPTKDVAIGDVAVVRAGERFSIDGIVISGASTAQESVLTGESRAVLKRVGDRVLAGALNGDGVLHVRATTPGASTAVAKIVDSVRRAQTSQPEIARVVDRVSSVFVPAVLIIATLTFLAWFNFGGLRGPVQGALCTAAVLLVACPCALGLATPISVSIAISRLAQLGVLVRDARSIEKAAGLQEIVFDKTGTITMGEPRVTHVHPSDGASEDEVLTLAAALESTSLHPIAQGVVREGKARKLTWPRVEHHRTEPGRGVAAWLEGVEVRVGSASFAGGAPGNAGDSEAASSETAVFVNRNGSVLGSILLADSPRPEAERALADLRALGLHTRLISGDRATVARAMGDATGIDDVQGDILPGDKARIIRDLQAKGTVVAMVGDGINDAPALAQADVGIAMGGGTAVAEAAAALSLTGNDLSKIPLAIRASRATLANIRQNLVGAFAYNVVAILVASGALVPFLGERALLSPLLAGVAMSMSSVSVVANALRLKRLA